ncbi:MAG: hypothetical protein DPW09_40330 [Anaerolineae bacterium]|nr:hypothetical protein [Anaerolineae bacterium]
MVSNLKQMPGIVRLDPASERQELVVTFNADQTSLETMVARLEERGEAVTSWRILK